MRACFVLARVHTPSSTVIDVYKEREGERERVMEREREIKRERG